jgi:hypothetical protein
MGRDGGRLSHIEILATCCGVWVARNSEWRFSVSLVRVTNVWDAVMGIERLFDDLNCIKGATDAR